MTLATLPETGHQAEPSGDDGSFRLLGESVEEFALILLDPRGNVSSWNPSAARLTGYGREKIVGKHFSCLHTPEDIARKLADAELESAEKDGRFEGEGWRLRQDGSPFYAKVIIKALTDSDGALTGFAKLVRDTTAHRKTEEELRKLSTEMERFFEMSLDLICVAGRDGYFKKLNPAWEKTLGFSIAELLARPWAEFIHPDDRAATLAELKKMERGVDVNHFENRYLHKDGSIRWLAWKAPAIRKGQDYVYATARDVTEMKRAEEELRGSQARLKLALDAAQIGDWELNLETHATRRSLKHDQIFGYNELLPEWTYEMFLAHVHPEDRARVDAAFKESISAGKDWSFECRIIRKDGTERQIWARGGIYPDASGHRTQMLGLVGDSTERKQDEVQIATLLQRLDLAAHGAHLGIWDWDVVRNELLWDDRMYELYGLKKGEFTGTHEAWLERIHDDDRSLCDDAIHRALRGEKEYDIDFRVLWPDGTIRVLRANGQIVRDPWGTPIRMTGISSDITDRRRAEQRVALQLAVSKVLSESATLEEATPRLVQALVEAVSASFGALWRVDAAANVVRCINVWHRPDIDVKEFEPATSESAFPPGVGLPGRVWQSRKPLWIPDVTTDSNFPRIAAAGAAGLHAAFGAPILSGQTCLGVIEFFTHEIYEPDTELLEVCAGIGSQIGQFIERKQAEEKLGRLGAVAVQRATLLEAANKELEAFSYMVSHDLRAPLRHVQGYVELLNKATTGQLSEPAAGYLSAIADASRQMKQLIDDLLSFSRLGRAEMHRSTVPLDDIVQSCLAALELETGSRKILWKFAPLPSVTGDPAMLRQVFANLIGNAVKYTGRRERAEIEIGCAGREDGRAIIFVRDNGVGFDMQSAGKLFGVFQRLHTTAEFEGTGIGLANVRRIITRHGGRIWPEAAVDKGATFYFTLEEASPPPNDAAAK